MIEPNYDKILQSKINSYGETKAAYEFAAYEYNKQYIELNKLSIQLVSQQRELLLQCYKEGFQAAVDSLVNANEAVKNKTLQ